MRAAERSIRVVVVDDEDDIRFLVRRQLSSDGRFRVVGEATDGSEAIEVIGRLQPAAVLLDLMMQTRGGDALPGILCVAPTCMVAVLSALPTEQNRDRLLSLGAFAYYVKTGPLDDLPSRLWSDYARFREALNGQETVPSWQKAAL